METSGARIIQERLSIVREDDGPCNGRSGEFTMPQSDPCFCPQLLSDYRIDIFVRRRPGAMSLPVSWVVFPRITSATNSQTARMPGSPLRCCVYHSLSTPSRSPGLLCKKSSYSYLSDDANSAAGSETTAGVVTWWVQAMILYPEVQARAQAELDAVVGRDRIPTFADYEHMPYMRAMAKEVRCLLPCHAPLPCSSGPHEITS